MEDGTGDGWMEAVTHYRLTACIKTEESGDVSLVELTLETGRTHQIRAHMAAIGHPLLGDPVYGTDRPSRAALHCREITFHQPVTGEIHTVSCKIPEDMKQMMDNP